MAYYNEDSANRTMKNRPDRYKYHLKKITQILLPLSVFSLIFSHSSIAPLFVDFYDYIVSNFIFKLKLFSYTTERNCIFLLCNGILVLIIQSSGLIKPGPETATTHDHRRRRARKHENARFEERGKKGVGSVEILEEKDEESFQSCEVEKWDDDEGGTIDTEELEKKCEDFIRKVKLEIHSA